MTTFRKKPQTVEAFRFGHDEIPDWFENACRDDRARRHRWGQKEHEQVLILAKGSNQEWCHPGSWIVKEADGELHRWTDKAFREAFEGVSS